MATEWRLTEFSSDIDANFATKDFMKWTGPEKQNTVPVRGQTVPVRGQSGTCERTVVAEMSRTGTYERTVEAQKSPVLSPDGYAYSIPGGRPSKRDAGLPTAVAEPEPNPVRPKPEPTEPEPAAVRLLTIRARITKPRPSVWTAMLKLYRRSHHPRSPPIAAGPFLLAISTSLLT